MFRIHATAVVTLLALAAGPAAAQSVEPGAHQEGIADERAATNAIVKTEDTPVIEEDDLEDADGLGEGFDVDVIRETPDPDPGEVPAVAEDGEETLDPALATRAADPDVEGGRAEPEMFPGQIAPTSGAAPGRGRIYAEELTNYTIHLADVENFGKVERLIINLETGLIERLVVSAGGGILGIGETRFQIPFNQVAAINTEAKEMRVAVSRTQIELPGDTAESVRPRE